jgi:hypothetical protein
MLAPNDPRAAWVSTLMTAGLTQDAAVRAALALPSAPTDVDVNRLLDEAVAADFADTTARARRFLRDHKRSLVARRELEATAQLGGTAELDRRLGRSDELSRRLGTPAR